MRHNANLYLSEEEISRRDERIARTMACIEGLEQRFSLGLYPAKYANLLIPGDSPGIHFPGKRVFGEAWLDKKLDYLEELLLKELATAVLTGIEKRPRNDPTLRGSAWRVAEKLCVYRFAGDYPFYQDPDNDYPPPYEFDCDVAALRIGLGDLVEVVCERIEKQHMRYRLWDADAIEQLEHYLYYEVPDSDLYIEGALSTRVYGRPADVKEFLAGVADAIAELPVRELTECTFPDDYPEQVRFSDYVPPQNMTAEQIDQLYQNYLKWYEAEKRL